MKLYGYDCNGISHFLIVYIWCVSKKWTNLALQIVTNSYRVASFYKITIYCFWWLLEIYTKNISIMCKFCCNKEIHQLAKKLIGYSSPKFFLAIVLSHTKQPKRLVIKVDYYWYFIVASIKFNLVKPFKLLQQVYNSKSSFYCPKVLKTVIVCLSVVDFKIWQILVIFHQILYLFSSFNVPKF